MNSSTVILHLAGAVALLLWATRMVTTGVERAYGDTLRNRLRNTMRHPVMAAAAGLMLSLALQSSTAVTLMISSFAGSGIVAGMSGILAVRGAEVGSALAVKILSYDLSILIPICLIFGTMMFRTTEQRTWRQSGRIVFGAGLIILSLHMLSGATEPLRNSDLLPVIVSYLASDPIIAYLLSALITWLVHSSIASVLLLMALAGAGIVNGDLIIVMVLGINLGSSVIVPLLTRHSPAAVRILPLSNLMMRGAGSMVMLALVMTLHPSIAFLGDQPGDRVVNAHILFNVIIFIVGVPLSHWVIKASELIASTGVSPESEAKLGDETLSALDKAALGKPAHALANAGREVLRACATVELMLQRVIDLYEYPDKKKIEELASLDDGLDSLHGGIKFYLAGIAFERMSAGEAARCHELLDACVKLEQVGDIVVRNMLPQAQKKLKHELKFTDAGWRELCGFHSAVLANARLAFSLLVNRDPELARQLVHEKDRLRKIEKETSLRHFERLREGSVKSAGTSSIHLDTIRDLKQINSLLASLAYPVLEQQGLLRGSRLKSKPESTLHASVTGI